MIIKVIKSIAPGSGPGTLGACLMKLIKLIELIDLLKLIIPGPGPEALGGSNKLDKANKVD